jgi:hypothetical protein
MRLAITKNFGLAYELVPAEGFRDVDSLINKL